MREHSPIVFVGYTVAFFKFLTITAMTSGRKKVNFSCLRREQGQTFCLRADITDKVHMGLLSLHGRWLPLSSELWIVSHWLDGVPVRRSGRQSGRVYCCRSIVSPGSCLAQNKRLLWLSDLYSIEPVQKLEIITFNFSFFLFKQKLDFNAKKTTCHNIDPGHTATLH